MRGVYWANVAIMHALCGSSPHARGLLSGDNQHIRVDRIIPACAGFTVHVPLCYGRGRDHPRMRGVYASVGAPIIVL